ncbi:hypothetical protein MHU86_20147 [Fragilaria crotonensis]|nr:hypothetical protein MHU86_20147 [Fragilaria crotonensis]
MPTIEDALVLLTAEECVVTLAKVLDNILTEEKYEKKTRKFKLSNETFKRRVVRHSGGLEVLIACQFSKKGQTLQLLKEHESKMVIWNARRALQERADYLGFALSKMPPKPKNVAPVSHDSFETTSLYETSTIATIDDLDLEISKELEDSPVSTVPYQTSFPSFGIPTISPPVQLANDSPGRMPLGVPELPKSPTILSSTKPPLAPRLSSKSCEDESQKKRRETDALQKEFQEALLPGRAPAVDLQQNNTRRYAISPDDRSQLLADRKGERTQHVPLSLPQVSTGNASFLEDTEEALSAIRSLPHQPKTQPVTFAPKSDPLPPDDSLLKEMEDALMEDGWAEDGAFLDEPDTDVGTDAGMSIEGNINVSKSRCDSQREAQLMLSSEDADPKPAKVVPTEGSLTVPIIAGEIDFGMTDDCLLQKMKAELSDTQCLPISDDVEKEIQNIFTCSKEKEFSNSPSPQTVNLVSEDKATTGSTGDSQVSISAVTSQPNQYHSLSNAVVSHNVNVERQPMSVPCPTLTTEHLADSEIDVNSFTAVRKKAVYHGVESSQCLVHSPEGGKPSTVKNEEVESVSLKKGRHQ